MDLPGMMLDIPEGFPIYPDGCGGYRVGSQVPLDLVVHALRAGFTPEQIAAPFPGLRLADVVAVQVYYLNHKDTVDAYLAVLEEEHKRKLRLSEASSDSSTDPDG
jgi:uncharacterized protein (DUF433 family)